ncbi:KH domain-containing protein [Apostasia shenzhenica]|uniref:KH domain-containing protein n=1 Tax=Apostasia shenzhenica TaxID=1088818 RepID=A0A2H9ZTI2_9ASPA|nr:KH domain-containing protein [Apostasia shenzhenica]
MDRPRSKRGYHYDQDSDSQTPRTKPRYDGSGHRRANHYRRSGDRRPPPPPPPPHPPPSAASSSSNIPDGPLPTGTVTTFFRLLCPENKTGGVIGKSGNIIKNVRQETGAWINVQDLVPGDDERIIETADDRRREPDGRPPRYSPAQEALLMIHDRVVDLYFEDEGEEDYGVGVWRAAERVRERERERARVTTRLVVPRTHVGCLLGKGGKIIEHMRNETRTHIRILPRDQYTPRCVSMLEEVVQVVGEGNCVKKAMEIISCRLKESLHRDRTPYCGRGPSPERCFFPDDDFISDIQHQSGLEGAELGPRSSLGPAKNRHYAYGSEHSSHILDSDADLMTDSLQSFSYEVLVFRILCPNDKAEAIFSFSNGVMDMLQTDIGVDVSVADPVEGSSERIIIITSDEGPDDELFPAQEALLHVQTHISDLGPDKDNIITTRLLVSASELSCLEDKDGSLSDIQRLTCANVQILPKEDLPLCAFETDELIQIVGEIRAARKALLHVTEKIRSYLYRDISSPKETLPPSIPVPRHSSKVAGPESTSFGSLSREGYRGSEPPIASYQNVCPSANWLSKDTAIGASGSLELEQNAINDSGRQSELKRFSTPLVTKSTLEVVIPENAVPSLISKSGCKLAQISEMSGATVNLLDEQPDSSVKVVQISGTPEQAERAQSLLQGFILSSKFCPFSCKDSWPLQKMTDLKASVGYSHKLLLDAAKNDYVNPPSAHSLKGHINLMGVKFPGCRRRYAKQWHTKHVFENPFVKVGPKVSLPKCTHYWDSTMGCVPDFPT